jgi:NitT/TauT family transport system substrate-binding protein
MKFSESALFPRAACSFAAATMLAFSPLPGHAQTETVTFAIPGVVTIGFAPLTFGEKGGYFAEEKLKLDVVVLQGSGEILPQLVKGSVLVSMITPDVLIMSRQPGKPNFPVRFVYNVYRNSFWQMSVLDSSPIRTIADLKGKTVGVGALTFASVPQTKALLRRQGVDPASVTFVAVGSGPAAAESLRQGRVDALNLFATNNAMMEAQGTKIRRLAYPPDQQLASSHGLAFSDKTINERPDLVGRVGRAHAKGVLGCQTNPRACLEAFWATYPAMKPPVVDETALRTQLSLLKVVLDLMTAFSESGPARFGAYKEQDFRAPIESLKAGGELGNAPIALSSLYTDRFVDEFNRFDRKAVIDKAKAY